MTVQNRRRVTRYANPVTLTTRGTSIDTVTGDEKPLTERMAALRASGDSVGLMVHVPAHRAGEGGAGSLRVEDIDPASGAGSATVIAINYNVRDSYGTTWQPGCIAAGTPDLATFAGPWLFMHDRWDPRGVFRVIEDNDEHLLVEVVWDDTQAGRDACTMAKSGSAPGASVGVMLYIHPEDEDPDTIKMAELVEVSQTTLNQQAVPGAGVVEVRIPVSQVTTPEAPAETPATPEDPDAPEVIEVTPEPDVTADEDLLTRARAFVTLYGTTRH